MSFLSNLQWRYATKKFDTTKKVSPENKAKILEAIRFAPSSFGMQPIHITIVENQEVKNQLREKAYGQAQLSDSDFVLVFSARTDLLERTDTYFDLLSNKDKEIRGSLKGFEDSVLGAVKSHNDDSAKAWTGKQAYIALGFGLAAAAELEVDACPMEGFDRDAFKSILKMPEYMHPQVIMCVGYRSSEDQIRPKVRFPEADLFDTVS